MEEHRHRRLLILLTIFVWATGAVAWFGKIKLGARAPITVNLAAKPNAVRLTLDSERLYDGNYADTPLKLQVPPGRHKLKISRDGYVAHLVTIEGDPGEIYHMEDVVLQRIPGLVVAAVDVMVGDKEPALHAEIDDGFVHGDTPLEATDLTADQVHIVTVYPKWPDKDGRVRCRFTTGPLEGDSVYHIKFHGKPPKYKTTGCDRLKERTKNH